MIKKITINITVVDYVEEADDDILVCIEDRQERELLAGDLKRALRCHEVIINSMLVEEIDD